MDPEAKTPLSEDECHEAQEEDAEEEDDDEISDNFLLRMVGDKPHMLTNPLEIRCVWWISC